MSAPASASEITATSGRPVRSATASTTSAAKSDAPVASPSRPSIRLKALLTPTTQTSVKTRLRTGGTAKEPTKGTVTAPMRPPRA